MIFSSSSPSIINNHGSERLHPQGEDADVGAPVLVPVPIAAQAVLVEVAEIEPIAVRVADYAICHPNHCP
jgi:hypothetical protein